MTYDQDYWDAVADTERSLQAFGEMCAEVAAVVRDSEVADE